MSRRPERWHVVQRPKRVLGPDGSMTSPPSILWFRRDLRFEDHPALAKAAKRGPVLALFVLDPALMPRRGCPGGPSFSGRCTIWISACALWAQVSL
jgi:hypothetical protein